MRGLYSPPTRSPGASRQPAMALMEALAAAAILAWAFSAFTAVLREAQNDLARARNNAQAAALAAMVLHQARDTWADGPYIGEHGAMNWRLRCAVSPLSSPRILLIGCNVSVAMRDELQPIIVLETAFAQPRARRL